MTGRRDFDPLSQAQIAAGRVEPRSVGPAARFRPAAPQAVAELLDAIQHVAEAATGERSFLHVRPGPARPGGHAPLMSGPPDRDGSGIGVSARRLSGPRSVIPRG